jgi:hypothetical protein
MIDTLQTLKDNGCTHSAIKAVLDNLVNEDAFCDDDDRRCCVALLHYYDNEGECDPDECVPVNGNTIKVAGMEFLVLTDDEADEALDDYLEQLLDEDGMVSGADSPYFDRDAWKRDAAMDGRGHSLAGYDGDEHECGDYLLYRTN